MSNMFLIADKSSIHMSFNSQLFLQGFRVASNERVRRCRFVDVHLIVLLVFGRGGAILAFTSSQIYKKLVSVYFNKLQYLYHVHSPIIRKDSVHPIGCLVPLTCDGEMMQAIAIAVQAQVVAP